MPYEEGLCPIESSSSAASVAAAASLPPPPQLCSQQRFPNFKQLHPRNLTNYSSKPFRSAGKQQQAQDEESSDSGAN
jgi:hypothetical protein